MGGSQSTPAEEEVKQDSEEPEDVEEESEDVEEEEEEEEDLIDPIIAMRESCSELTSSKKLWAKYEECNARVTSKSNTQETCEEELYDFLHFVDHCVAHNIFSKLK